MSTCKNLVAIMDELSSNAQLVKQEEVDAVVDLIVDAKRVFVAGAGRSGFAISAFANRLTHLGLDVHFAGEATCPAIAAGDVIVIGSGGGSTSSMVSKAKQAKAVGASVATLTLNAQGQIGQMADAVVVVPGVSPHLEGAAAVTSIQPMGSAFEQMCFLIYDSMVLSLMERLGQDEDEMFSRHSNLE